MKLVYFSGTSRIAIILIKVNCAVMTGSKLAKCQEEIPDTTNRS